MSGPQPCCSHNLAISRPTNQTGDPSSLLEEASGSDILVFGAVDYRSRDGQMVPGDVYAYPDDISRTGKEHVRAMSEKLKMCVPFCMFRRDFLLEKGLRFVPGLLHEDAEYIPRVF